MGIWDKVRGELIDIVQWIDDTNDTMVYRFERYNNQIKYGAQLTVREGQTAVFVNEGKIADVFQPGMYTLETKNLPILSTLQGWKYGFNSPFMAEVYFCSMRQFTDLKWGTMNPIMMRDAEFGPVRLRAYGSYVVKVNDPQTLIRQIVGTDGRFTVEEIVNQLRNLIVSRFAEIAGQSKIPVLDMAANYGEMGEFLTKRISPEFQTYGLELAKAAGGKHFAARGGRRSTRQTHKHGRGRKPRGVYPVQHCQFDSGCGQKSRRTGGCRRRHRHGNGYGSTDRASSVRTTAGRFCIRSRRRLLSREQRPTLL